MKWCDVKRTKRLEATAYHEAGHIVVAMFSDYVRKPKKVTIVPMDDNLGSVTVGNFESSFRPDIRSDAVTLAKVVNECTVLFSGAASEKKFTGRSNHQCASQDYQHAVKFASYVVIGDEELAKIASWLYVRAETQVDVRWIEIEKVAAALLDKGTLSSEQVRRILFGDALVDLGKKLRRRAKAQIEQT